MSDHPGWKSDSGQRDVRGLMLILSSLNDREANRLRDMIRQYGITSPEEFLFYPASHYLQIRNTGKVFFLNLKKALLQNGLPYDRDTLEEIEKKIADERQSCHETFTRLRFEILKRDNFTCQYCGRSPRSNPDVILEMDHKYPSSLGGEWTKENIVTSCRECNSGKSDILLEAANK
jgi:hypothetical protein